MVLAETPPELVPSGIAGGGLQPKAGSKAARQAKPKIASSAASNGALLGAARKHVIFGKIAFGITIQLW